MTDAEIVEVKLAEAWVGENGFCSDCNNLNSVEANREMINAFLAGLKAGRPKWHKVADGDLPKDEEYKWCVSPRGYPYVARYEELFVSWTNRENKEVICPYAWKEIVLPELKEIK